MNNGEPFSPSFPSSLLKYLPLNWRGDGAGGNLKSLQLQFTITPLLFIYKLVQGHKYKLITKSLILRYFSIKNIIVSSKQYWDCLLSYVIRGIIHKNEWLRFAFNLYTRSA